MSATACVGVGYNSSSGVVPVAGGISLTGTAASAGIAVVPALPGSPAPTPISPEQAGFNSVSCAASTCTAVGFYEDSVNKDVPIMATTTGGTFWSVTTVTAPSAATGGADLTAVSCASGGGCEAVGNYVDGSGHVQSWSIQLGAGTAQTLTPPPGAVAISGTLPNSPSLSILTSGPAMTGISCPGVDACTAIGEYGTATGATNSMAFTISNGSPAAGVSLPAEGTQTTVSGIWCSDASDCTAIGDLVTASGSSDVIEPVTLSETSGSWSALANMPGTSPGASESIALGLGCNAVDTCLADGATVNTSASSIVPMVDFSAPPLSVTTSSLPAGTAGSAYSATLQGAGGAGTSSWSINGSLPPGLSLNAATGVISGTPTVAGSYSFTAQLASAGPPSQSASVNLSVTVAAAAPAPKPPAVPGTVSAGAAKISPTAVTLPLGCSGSGPCTGSAVITGVEHLNGKKPTAVTPRVKKRTLKITLASGSYSLTAGQLSTINLQLTAQAKSLLKKLHTIKGTLTVTPTGASAPTVTQTVTFKSATRKHKKK